MIWFLLFNSFVYYICSIVCCYSVLVNLEKYFIYYFPIWLYLLLGSLAIPKSHTNYVNVLEDVGRATEYSFICTQYDVHFEEWRRYRITRNLWKNVIQSVQCNTLFHHSNFSAIPLQWVMHFVWFSRIAALHILSLHICIQEVLQLF